MSKSKKAAKKQPEWLNQSPTVMMRRELENATTHICHVKGLKPSKPQNPKTPCESYNQ